MITIRRMQLLDTPRLAEIASAVYMESSFTGIEVDPQTFYRYINQAVTDSSMGAWVAEMKGKAEGFMVAGLYPLFFSKKLAAVNHIVLVTDQGRGAGIALIRKYVQWAKNNPRVGQITLSATSGMPQQERVEQLFNRLGRRIGAVYEVEV